MDPLEFTLWTTHALFHVSHYDCTYTMVEVYLIGKLLHEYRNNMTSQVHFHEYEATNLWQGKSLFNELQWCSGSAFPSVTLFWRAFRHVVKVKRLVSK